MIKKTVKKFLNITKEVYFILEWFLYSIVYGKENSKISKINDSVIVVGNGPSILNFDFQNAKDKGFEFLGVNYFALDEERFFNVRPKYYCIIDPFFYESNNREKYPNITKLESVLKEVNWELTLIILSGQIPNLSNNHVKYIRLNSNVYRGNLCNFKKYLYNHNLASFTYQNVINAAMYYLITAKAKLILLIGVENDWHRELSVSSNNDVFRETRHFYGTEKINITEKGEINRGELYKYFYWYYITLLSHLKASDYAKENNVKVYNCTLNSYIDVFEKRDWNSV